MGSMDDDEMLRLAVQMNERASEPVDSDAFFAGVREAPRVWPKVPRVRVPRLTDGVVFPVIIGLVAALAIWASSSPPAAPAHAGSVEIAPSAPTRSTGLIVGPSGEVDTGIGGVVGVRCSQDCKWGAAENSGHLPAGFREHMALAAGLTLHVWAAPGTRVEVQSDWR